MAAKVHCESSRQLGFALSYTLPSTLKRRKKTVFMVTSGLFLCLFRLNYRDDMNLKDNKKNSFPHPVGEKGRSKILHGIGSHETEYNIVDTSVTISYKITWFTKVSSLY